MANLSQGIQGGVGGALGGGGVGGPLGAAIGGGLGFLGGFFGSSQNQYQQRLMQMEQEWANRRAPQAGQAAQGAMSGFRGNQTNLIGQLEALSRGRGPSLASNQIQQTADRLASDQSGLAAQAAGRGVNAGGAFLQASNAGASIGAQANAAAGNARVQEQLGAMQQLGLTLHGARDQDEQNSRFNAGQNNEVMLANLDAQLRAMGMNDQARLTALASAMAGGQGPGLGSQLLAGGASMFPYLSGQNAAGGGQGGGQPIPAGANFGQQYSPGGGTPMPTYNGTTPAQNPI